MTVAEVGELGLLAELERRGLARGIENDAAELPGGVVVTQDVFVEGVHFRLDWSSWRDVGFRAAAASLSDLSACGAEPEALIVGLGLRGGSLVEQVVELYEGIREAGVPVLGGDTTEAGTLVLGVTAVGRSPRVPGRGGAQPGDLLVVTGPLGAAGAAFRRQGSVRPPIRVEEGKRLAHHAHAMLDLSDGLGIDTARLAARSGCRVVVELERVPLADGATIEDLAFGEDFELLAAVADPEDFPVIGRCEEGQGVAILHEGNAVELRGWEHFR